MIDASANRLLIDVLVGFFLPLSMRRVLALVAVGSLLVLAEARLKLAEAIRIHLDLLGIFPVSVFLLLFILLNLKLLLPLTEVGELHLVIKIVYVNVSRFLLKLLLLLLRVRILVIVPVPTTNIIVIKIGAMIIPGLSILSIILKLLFIFVLIRA